MNFFPQLGEGGHSWLPGFKYNFDEIGSTVFKHKNIQTEIQIKRTPKSKDFGFIVHNHCELHEKIQDQGKT